MNNIDPYEILVSQLIAHVLAIQSMRNSRAILCENPYCFSKFVFFCFDWLSVCVYNMIALIGQAICSNLWYVRIVLVFYSLLELWSGLVLLIFSFTAVLIKSCQVLIFLSISIAILPFMLIY